VLSSTPTRLAPTLRSTGTPFTLARLLKKIEHRAQQLTVASTRISLDTGQSK
jgi:hypothetical protein